MSDENNVREDTNSPLDQENKLVVQNFKKYMEDPNTSVSIAAIKALTDVVSSSTSITKSGLQKELKTAVNSLVDSEFSHSISLTSGCELFTNFITKTDSNDFKKYKEEIVERAEKFLKRSDTSREKIGMLFVDNNFINDDCVILIHGYSRVVFSILSRAVNEKKKRFSVIMTESKYDQNAKYVMANKLKELDIPYKVILDCAVAHVIPSVDIVLLGCEGVVENGGIINCIGTFQISIVAKAHKKPVYVGSESFKFVRLFPLGQSDVPKPKNAVKKIETNNTTSIEIENYENDYTPPEYITLLFTELGILTPSAVSDELIKLYY